MKSMTMTCIIYKKIVSNCSIGKQLCCANLSLSTLGSSKEPLANIIFLTIFCFAEYGVCTPRFEDTYMHNLPERGSKLLSATNF